MTQYKWPPRTAKIDVLIIILIPHFRPGTTLEKQRGTPYRLECANRRVYTSGKQSERLLKELGRIFGLSHHRKFISTSKGGEDKFATA
jgi:hypothetical protein